MGQFSKNNRTLYPKNCHQALKNVGLGSGIRDPGSGKNLFRIPGSKRHRIPDPGVIKSPDPGTLKKCDKKNDRNPDAFGNPAFQSLLKQDPTLELRKVNAGIGFGSHIFSNFLRRGIFSTKRIIMCGSSEILGILIIVLFTFLNRRSSLKLTYKPEKLFS